MSISGGAGADILAQLINGVTRNLLPQGHDHSSHAPTEALQEGRIDVIISHAIAGQVSGAHPIVQAMYGGARAVLDGALTAVAGPVAIEGMIRSGASALGYGSPKKVQGARSTKKKSTAVAKRKKPAQQKGKEYTAAGVEIVDAEFVDVPGASAPRGGR